jgi:hypothetical protein
MSIRSVLARPALAALLALAAAALVPAAASARTATAELRVLTPTKVLDPGTTYVVGPESVRTDPNADCNFGGAGGSGDTFEFPDPVLLSLLQAGSEASSQLRPLSVTDEFGFGLAVCAVGGVDDAPGTFWYLKRNHQELTVGADQEPIRNGDEALIYLAPDNFPAPNPAELELRAPVRAQPGDGLRVKAIVHSCVTDPNTFEVTCESAPAADVTVSGSGVEATTAADGRATIQVPDRERIRLAATRGADIPSERLEVCISDDLGECAPKRGERIVGTSAKDRIRGTRGTDAIRARGGPDRIDIRNGGFDRVNCGGGRDLVIVGGPRGVDDVRIRGNCERVRERARGR